MKTPRKRLPSMSTQVSTTAPKAKTRPSVLNTMLTATLEIDRSGSMETYKGPIGVEAKLEFASTFRNRIKLQDRIRYNQMEISPTLAYLIEVEKRNLSPKSLGVVFPRGKTSSMDMRNYQVGDSYARAISRGVPHMRNISEMNITSNRLTDRGIRSLLHSADWKQLQKLNLSNNRIGNLSIEQLTSSLGNSSISELILDRTYLSEVALGKLCKAVGNSNSVHFLGLANNRISNALAIGELIKYTNSVRKLDLHWNNIKEESACAIFEGLCLNESVQELDMSWNSIGNSSSPDGVFAIGQCFAQNETLKHLDLSYNNFTYAECERLSVSLNQNQNLLGIHMVGNHACVDYRGAIIPRTKMTKVKNVKNFSRIFREWKFVPRRERINCWICEKWIEFRFEWIPGLSGDCHNGPIYIHFEFNDYEPIHLTQHEDGVFYIDMEIPPTKMKFYFSKEEERMLSAEYPIKTYTAGEFNYLPHPTGPECTIARKNLKVLPRAPSVADETVVLEKIPWDFHNSLFKDYQVDSEELLEACFKADLQDTKLESVVRSEEELKKVIQLLRVNYKYIRDWYKNLASYGTLKIPSVGFSVFKDFLKKCKLLSEHSLQSSLGVQWGAVNVPKDKGFQLNPISTLVRYEFMEMLVRFAMEKFAKNNSLASEALSNVLDAIIPAMEPSNGDLWRKNEYHIEQVDLVLSVHKPILEAVYGRFAGKLSRRKNFMVVEEFREILIEAEIANDCFGLREGDVCFHQSMMTQVDELHTSRHFEMNFVEFLEAITRVADKANLAVDHKDPKHRDDSLQVSLLPKLEALMPYLLKLCPKNIQTSFKFPTAESYSKLMYDIR